MEYMAAAGAAASILGLLTRDDSSAQISAATPTVAPVTPMPAPNDEAATAVKKKMAVALSARRGRQSTILSDNTQSTDLLGA